MKEISDVINRDLPKRKITEKTREVAVNYKSGMFGGFRKYFTKLKEVYFEKKN